VLRPPQPANRSMDWSGGWGMGIKPPIPDGTGILPRNRRDGKRIPWEREMGLFGMKRVKEELAG
jgi:hypothetical protein